VRGAVSLKRGAASDAVVHLRGAVKLVDSWLARLALARAYVDAGSFPEALEELEKLEKRRGEGTDVFLDVVPSVRFLPVAIYFTGRAREGLRDPKSADAYRAFLALKQTDEDPMVLDARRRLAKLNPAEPRP
jgi:hypothetical protein